jgi:hypothetical protein
MSGYGETGYENRGPVGGPERGGYGVSHEGLMAGGLATLLCGVAAGAALMYFFDPDMGRRRRALLRDKAVGMSNDLGEAATGAARDLRNRTQGLVAEAGSALGVTGGGGEQSGTEEGARRQSATA